MDIHFLYWIINPGITEVILFGLMKSSVLLVIFYYFFATLRSIVPKTMLKSPILSQKVLKFRPLSLKGILVHAKELNLLHIQGTVTIKYYLSVHYCANLSLQGGCFL